MDDKVKCPVTGRTWDLLNPEDQRAAWTVFHKTRPKLLVASPPCTLFSCLQNLNGKPDPEKYRKAVKMVEFAVDMCVAQHRAGRRFVFEHPATASSWKLPCLQKLAELKGMYSVDFNMCCFGMKVTKPDGKTGMVLKQTRVYTNSESIDSLLDRRCSKDHDHIPLIGGLAKQAAIYTKELCDAMIDGIVMEEMHANESVEMGMMALTDMCDPLEEQEIQESMWGIDDVSGEWINPNLIKGARRDEMEGFKEHKVYHHVLRAQAAKDTSGKFIGVRWVDHNKGTRAEPIVRSRLVGQEFANGEHRDDLFAPTPPLAAARFLLSTCASRGRRGPGGHRVLLLDIKKAFLYGRISRNVYIELPEEDPMSESGLYVGKLDKTMYGTRDAPAAWQDEVEKTMKNLGFEPCVSTPCLYYHPETKVRVVAHVDDMMCVGDKDELDEFLTLLKSKYKLTSTILGPGPGEEKEGKFLGRSIGWTKEGLTWTGDRKLVEEMLEDWQMTEARSVDTPGVKETDNHEDNYSDEPMSKEDGALYRKTAAKLNYVSLDNPRIAFAAKEASRSMSNPKKGEESKIKRLLRFLRERPVSTYQFRWQDSPDHIDGYTDSDWAGCKTTRRSTSGGVILHGAHLIAHWSRTQAGVALSSGEAELNAALKMGCEVVGLRQFCSELGHDLAVRVSGDSSAVKGMLARKGCGKVKHIEVKQLWLQEKVRTGVIEFDKIPRNLNPGDAFTHHYTAAEAKVHFWRMGLR